MSRLTSYFSQTGILFESSALTDIGLDPASVWPEVKPRPPPVTSIPTEDLHLIKTITSVKQEAASTAPGSVDAVVSLVGTSTSAASIGASTATLTHYADYDPLGTAIAGTPSVQLSEEAEELLDATSPIYDQLAIAKGWW